MYCQKKAIGLPEQCFTTLPSDPHQVICIKRGERGFYPTDWVGGQEAADALNDQLGVTKKQAEAMFHGSMFGWDTPGAQLPDKED